MPSLKFRLSPARQAELIRDFVAATPVFRLGDSIHHQNTVEYFQSLRQIIADRLAADDPFADMPLDLSAPGLNLPRASALAPEPQPLIALVRVGGKVRAGLIDWDGGARRAVGGLVPEAVVYRVKDSEPEKLPGSEFPVFRLCLRSDVAADRAAFAPLAAFWKKASNHLSRYGFVPVEELPLYLKECEWRLNSGTAEKQVALLTEWAMG